MLSSDIETILVISAHYYPLKGGTPTHTEYLCKGLAELGKNVVLVTADSHDEDTTEYDNAKNYTVHRLRTSKYFQNDLFFPLLVGLNISKYIAQIKPDIINISTGNYVPLGIKLSKKTSIPLVYTVHNVPPEEYSFNISKNIILNETLKKIFFRFIHFVAKATMRYGRYDAIISGSERTKERLLLAGAKDSDITVISYGVSLPDILNTEQKSDKCLILTVAGVIEHKGQLEIVKSIPEIIKQIPDAHFLFVGPIRSEAYFEKIKVLAEELGVTDKITITGEVSAEELDQYYSSCNIYLQPSYQEGFCLALMDAMTYEKPVVGTPVGAIPELIGSDRGVLIPSPKSQNIVLAVSRLASDTELAYLYGKNARKFIIDNYSWDKVILDTLNVYTKTSKDYHLGKQTVITLHCHK